MESLNERIKRLRKEKGISQSEVAKASGITQSSYASIEKGDTKSITIEVGKGIATALGISFNTIFEIEIDNQEKESFINQINDLTEKKNEKEKLYELLQKDYMNFKSTVIETSDVIANLFVEQLKQSLQSEEEDKVNSLLIMFRTYNELLLDRLKRKEFISQNDIDLYTDKDIELRNSFNNKVNRIVK